LPSPSPAVGDKAWHRLANWTNIQFDEIETKLGVRPTTITGYDTRRIQADEVAAGNEVYIGQLIETFISENDAYFRFPFMTNANDKAWHRLANWTNTQFDEIETKFGVRPTTITGYDTRRVEADEVDAGNEAYIGQLIETFIAENDAYFRFPFMTGVSPSPSPSTSPVVSPSPSASSGTTTSIEIIVKFAGVPANNSNINLPEEYYQQGVQVGFENQAGSLVVSDLTEFKYDPDSQVFKASLDFPLADLPSGNYNLLLKGPSHRQIRFCQNNQSADYSCLRSDLIAVTAGGSLLLDLAHDSQGEWGHVLEFGDVNWDGSVGVEDYSVVKACKAADARIGDDDYLNGCNLADGNFDGVVDNTDMDLLYLTISYKPDDE